MVQLLTTIYVSVRAENITETALSIMASVSIQYFIMRAVISLNNSQ